MLKLYSKAHKTRSSKMQKRSKHGVCEVIVLGVLMYKVDSPLFLLDCFMYLQYQYKNKIIMRH